MSYVNFAGYKERWAYAKTRVPMGNGSMTNTSQGTSNGYSSYCSSSRYCSSKVAQVNGFSKVRAASASVKGVLCTLSQGRRSWVGTELSHPVRVAHSGCQGRGFCCRSCSSAALWRNNLPAQSHTQQDVICTHTDPKGCTSHQPNGKISHQRITGEDLVERRINAAALCQPRWWEIKQL